MEVDAILVGNCIEVLKTIDKEMIDCVVTSPAYWNLRDYGTEKWTGGNDQCEHESYNPDKHPKNLNASNHLFRYDHTVCFKCAATKQDEQIGTENDFHDYIDKLCSVFDEIYRILKKEGTLFINIGDTYRGNNARASVGGRAGYGNKREAVINRGMTKCLCMIPSRFAIEMCNRGWILRNEIIWHKPNSLPSSAKDRFTCDFEKIFFFTKSKKYYFEQQFENMKMVSYKRSLRAIGNTKYNSNKYMNKPNQRILNSRNPDQYKSLAEVISNSPGRTMRTTWTISVSCIRDKHFATYPEKLIETPIKAGCPNGGIVLDPFMGSGTTAIVALKQHKHYIGIELNEEYVQLANERIKKEMLKHQDTFNFIDTTKEVIK